MTVSRLLPVRPSCPDPPGRRVVVVSLLASVIVVGSIRLVDTVVVVIGTAVVPSAVVAVVAISVLQCVYVC